jgi:hypothetical protein
MDFVVSLPRRSYIVPMKWMVINKYGVPGGALNLNSTNYPDHVHHGDPPLSGKNPHGRAQNRTWDLLISSQKCWPLDHEVGRFSNIIQPLFCSFRGQKNQMWIRFVVESWSLEKWYSRCTCHKNNTVHSFIILFNTVGARGGRSADATTNGTRKCLETIPSW